MSALDTLTTYGQRTRSLVPVVAMLTRNNIPAPTPTPDLQIFNLGCDRVMLRYTGALVTLIVNLAKNCLMASNFMTANRPSLVSPKHRVWPKTHVAFEGFKIGRPRAPNFNMGLLLAGCTRSSPITIATWGCFWGLEVSDLRCWDGFVYPDIDRSII